MENLYEMLPRQRKVWEIQMSYPDTDICNIGGYLHLEGKYDRALLQRCIEIFLQCSSGLWMKVTSQGKIYFDPIMAYRMEEYDFTGITDRETDEIIQRWICEPMPLYDSYLFDIRLLCLRDKTILFEKFHHLAVDGYGIALGAKHQEKIYEELLEGKTEFEIDRSLLEACAGAEEAEKGRNLIKACAQPEAAGKEGSGRKKEYENYRFASVAKRAVNPAANLLAGWITEGGSRPDEIEWCEKRFSYQKICDFCRTYRISVEALFYGCMAMYLCRAMDAEGLAIGRDLLNRRGEGLHVFDLEMERRTFVAEPNWELQALEYLAGLKKKLAVHAAKKEDSPHRPEIEISYRPQQYLPAPKQGECREFYNSSAEIPIKVFLNESRRGIEVIVKYQKDALSESKVRRVLAKTFFFMEQVVDQPEIPCDKLRLLRESEQRQMESLQKGEDWKYTLSLPERFLNMVHKYLEKKAVVWRGKAYSYREFYVLVKGIMGIIGARADSGRGRVIGLCLSRTPYLPAAIYASWLLGYGFLPVSRRESKERRQKMCQGCALCLTDEMLDGLAASLPDEKPSGLASEAGGIPCGPEFLAYEIYTSGTTGEPKAAQISHASLSCRLEWMEEEFGNGTDRILQKTMSSFDVSIWELVLPFAFGKTLYILEDGKERDPGVVAEALTLAGATMVHFVPSMFVQFLSFLEKDKREFPELRYILLSGEELGAELVHRAKERLPDVQLYNLYGPAECTIDVSYYRCKGNEGRIPIGRPVYDTGLSVRNQRGQLLPAGVQGELVVEGALVGLGYDGKEQGGYGVLEGRRAYWTGDLAVFLEDGLLYYEGRKDQQVKIRGMRINLTEVERRLNCAVPEVKSLVFPMGNRLIAFCQGDSTPEHMRREAVKHLAYYCVPSEFLFVDQFPLQENGKAGRKELVSFYQNQCPRKAIPQRFSINWELSRRELALLVRARYYLKRRDLTLDQNLLDAGLDSLTMLSFLADCSEYKIHIPYKVLYEKPYVRALAKESMKNTAKDGEPEKPLVFLRRYGSRKLLLAVPFAGGTPLSVYPLARRFERGGLDVAAVNLSCRAGFREKRMEMPAQEAVTSQEKRMEMLAQEAVTSQELEDYEEIYLLGACAGSVLAMRMAELLGERTKGLMLCGALPNQVSVWDYVSDGILEKILGKLRGKPVCADGKQLASFRADVKMSAEALRCMGKLEIKGNVTLVFGKKDTVTLGYRRRYRRWRRWMEKPFRVYSIPEAGHFFLEDHPSELARIIRREL